MTAKPEDFWQSAIERHDRQVFLSLLSLGLSPDRARDVAQATWTKLLEKHRDGKLDELELPGLAIVQARFLALNEMRRDQTEKRVLQVVDTPSRSRDVEREVINRVELETAIRALAECSAQAKKIFRMVYGRPPHTHAQVAREVGLSLQRVRQILCETRKTLRASISEGGAA